jgi:cation:H+ antiporter
VLPLSLTLIVASGCVLVHALAETARRVGVSESIIGATLAAFLISLPDLVIGLAALAKGFGEIAFGNTVGSIALTPLLVAGGAAAVTPGGLKAGPEFYSLLFPAMIFVLLVFWAGVKLSGSHVRRVFGLLLLGAYLAFLTASCVGTPW